MGTFFYRLLFVLALVAFLYSLITTIWAYVTHNQQLLTGFVALTGGLLVVTVVLGKLAAKHPNTRTD